MGGDRGGRIAVGVPGLAQEPEEAAERRHVRAEARLGGDMPEQVSGHVLGPQCPEVDRPVAEPLDEKAPNDEPVASDGQRRQRPVTLEVCLVPIFEPGQRRPVDHQRRGRNQMFGLEIIEKPAERGDVTLTTMDRAAPTTEVVRVTSTQVPGRPPTSVQPPPKRGQGPHVLSDRRPRIATLGQPCREPIEMRSDRIGAQPLGSGAVSQEVIEHVSFSLSHERARK